MKVGLVACCGPKLTTRAPAKDLYTSDLFRKSRAFVERTCDAWGILSAFHGLVMPDAIISPYDRTFADMGGKRYQDGWSQSAHCAIERNFPKATEFVFLAGKDYRCAAANHYSGPCRLPFTYPLDGMQIGARLRFLTPVDSTAVAEISTVGELCCPHRNADHEVESIGSPIRRCTVPGCKCTGWKSRKMSDRGGRPDTAKGRAL